CGDAPACASLVSADMRSTLSGSFGRHPGASIPVTGSLHANSENRAPVRYNRSSAPIVGRRAPDRTSSGHAQKARPSGRRRPLARCRRVRLLVEVLLDELEDHTDDLAILCGPAL